MKPIRKALPIGSFLRRLDRVSEDRRRPGRNAPDGSELDIMDESDLIVDILRPMGASRNAPLMVQIGANDGKFEYAKESEQDFVFEFLRENPAWSAILVEPLQDAFDSLKANYRDHANSLVFLKCAIVSRLGHGTLNVAGRDGKKSSLLRPPGIKIERSVSVLCLPWVDMCGLLDVQKVDFVKIDAEGMDAEIVLSILRCGIPGLVPDVIFYESIHTAEGRVGDCEAALLESGYHVFRSGLNKRGVYMDRLAVRNIDYQSV